MKLFAGFKIGERIRARITTGGDKKKRGGVGIGSIFLIIVLACMPFAVAKSCIASDEAESAMQAVSVTQAQAFELSDTSPIELEVGQTEDRWLVIGDGYGLTADDLVFVSSDENIVSVEFDNQWVSNIYFNIVAKAIGTVQVYAENADGSLRSEAISVTVKPEQTTAGAVVTRVVVVTDGYVLNSSSMRIHNPDCPSVADIKAENCGVTEDFYAAVAEGYQPCGRCNPVGE